MRLLFSASPSFGHIIPLLALAEAARQASHEVALLTAGGMAATVHPLRVLPVGPPLRTLLSENFQRFQGQPVDRETIVASYFATTRVERTFDEALAAARVFAPDLLIAEQADCVGPLVAAVLGIPWAVHTFGISPPPLADRIAAAVAPEYEQRGVQPTPALACLDIWPDLLQPAGWQPPANRITVRSQPYAQAGTPWVVPAFPGHEHLPLVLLTLGTVVDVPDLLATLLAALATAEVNVVVTYGSDEKAAAALVDRSRVLPVGFVPLAELLTGVALVVTVGGAGTTLAALGRGLPLAFYPLNFDQPWNAERTASLGAGIVLSRPEEAGAAANQLLTDPAYRAAAERVATALTHLNSAAQALDLLLQRLSQPGS